MNRKLCAALSLFLLTACTELDDVIDATGSAITDTRETLRKKGVPHASPPAAPRVAAVVVPAPVPIPVAVQPALPMHPFDMGEEDIPNGSAVTEDRSVEVEPLPAPPPLPEPVRYTPDHRPMIAIVIDDMGLDVKRSAWAADLAEEITLSYLPYAPKVQQQVDRAAANGHEIMLHMPMQAIRAGETPGPFGLFIGMTPEQIRKNTRDALSAFKGYDGVNNHMGSRFTSDRAGIDVFMGELEKRPVFFLDSKTAPTSVAEEAAAAHGIPATHRDVFIDHRETAAFVAAALNHAEDIARATGSAVAIGHPKDVTLSSLEVWMEGLEKRGLRLAPLAEVLKYRNQTAATVAQHIDNK